MKLKPVTKLHKNNKIPSKKCDNDVMSANCDVIVIFPILVNLEQFGSRIPNTVCKTYAFINSKLLSYKN